MLENGVWIGAKASVGPGITCGSYSVLAMGSVATKNLEEWIVYQGKTPVIELTSRHCSYPQGTQQNSTLRDSGRHIVLVFLRYGRGDIHSPRFKVLKVFPRVWKLMTKRERQKSGILFIGTIVNSLVEILGLAGGPGDRLGH